MHFFAAEDYQPALVHRFEGVAAAVRTVLPHARIEHVGASSVPGAISKGDLDVFVGVAGADHADSVAALEVAGFRIKADTLRTAELCMLEGTNPSAALQVVATGSRFEMFLHFRDALRTDAGLLAAYNAVKRRCAGQSPAAYRAEKARFIEGVLQTLHGRQTADCP